MTITPLRSLIWLWLLDGKCQVAAFSKVHLPLLSRVNTSSTSTGIKSSSSDNANGRVPFQYDSSQMPLCALGINFALQVPGYLPTLLSEEEREILFAGFSAQLKGGTTTNKNGSRGPQILQTFGPKLNEILQERRQAQMSQNQAKGAAFVEAFLKANPAAMTTETGLVYLATKPGDDISPKADATVTVYYQAINTLNGNIVDGNLDKDQPVTVTMANVVPGWAQGLQLMKQGGKATIVVPSHLAYGAEGSGDVVPPGATLQFDVELVQVQNPDDKVDVEFRSDDPQQQLTDENSEIVELPDGTRLRVPKGVKVRMVNPETQNGGGDNRDLLEG